MSYILTYTGKYFNPTQPDKKDIDIRDIAHALSLLCRANGHFKTFYSVGQHSINCMREARARGYSKRVQFACLLHDASEAYLSDVTTPVKQKLLEYQAFEQPLQDMIWLKYLGEALEADEIEQVFDIDRAVLYGEFEALMNGSLDGTASALCSVPEYAFESFEKTEEEFMLCFEALYAQIKRISKI